MQTPPSIIRAKTIKSVDISRMYLSGKSTPPRIEADSIGELFVTDMYTGEVRGHSTGSDEYAVIGSAVIDNLYGGDTSETDGPPAVVRCESFTTFDVSEGNGGDLHFKTIPANRTVRIGDKMSSQGGELTAVYRAGNIYVRTLDTLHGQVIINSDGALTPSAAEYCAGDVTIEHETTDITLSDEATTGNINTLPEYTRTSATVGGGAVGLAPFYLYDEDCNPVSGATGSASLLQSEFNNFDNDIVPTRQVFIRFYGPVYADTAGAAPVDLWMAKVLGTIIVYTLIPSSEYVVKVHRPLEAGASREIRMYGSGNYYFAAGEYRVRPRLLGGPQLYCDLVDGSPPVQDFDYVFTLRYDCDADGIEDEPGHCDDPGCPCPADFNQDGGIDGQDVEAFFVPWQAGTGGDANCDGGIDGQDVEAFFIAWENGGC